jgi:hypothetical protein
MKKIYNAPEAGLLCFRPVEALANEITFDVLENVRDNTLSGFKGDAAQWSKNDITIGNLL